MQLYPFMTLLKLYCWHHQNTIYLHLRISHQNTSYIPATQLLPTQTIYSSLNNLKQSSQTMAFALLAILDQRSAHSFPTGPVIAYPFISPLGLTITPALFESRTYTDRSVKSTNIINYKYVINPRFRYRN